MITRCSLIGLMMLVPLLQATAQTDGFGDRPMIRADEPLTREQLERRRADLQRREAEALFGMGIIHRRGDRLLQAIRSFEESLRLDPDAIPPRRVLLPLYGIFGRIDDADRMAKEIVERDPGDYETWLYIAERRKESNDLAAASTALQRGLQSQRLANYPDRILIFRRELASLYERQEQFAAAQRELAELIRYIESQRDALQRDARFRDANFDELLATNHERLGRLALRQQDYAVAQDAFRKAQGYFLKLTDRNEANQAHRLNWNLAEVFMAQEQWNDALTIMERYIRTAPSQIDAYEDWVKILRRLGRDGDIVPSLRKAVERDRHFVGLQLILARELARQPLNHREAEQLYLDLARQYHKAEIYRGLFRYYHGQQRVEEILNRLDETNKVAQRDDDVGSREERDAAIEQARVMLEALEMEPKILLNVLALAVNELRGGRNRESDTDRLLGLAAIRAKQSAAAETLLRQALIGAPPRNVLSIHAELLPILWTRHDYREIIRISREGLGRADANAAYFHSQLGLAYASIGQFDDALQHVDMAVKLSSDASRIRNRANRSRILATAGKYDLALAEAEALLQEAKLPEQIRAARLAISAVYTAQRNYAKSEEQLRLLLELDPNDALANNNLGYELADQGRNLDEAERLIRKAIALDAAANRGVVGADSANAAYLDSLGWVLFRKGKFTEARRVLEQAIELADGADDPTVWDHLGEVYGKLDLQSKAREAWNKALALYERDRFQPHYPSRAAEVRKKIQQLMMRD